MEPRGAALRTGLFVIGAIVVLVGLVFLLSGNMFRPGAIYESYFRESVQGLDVGSAVKFRGVTIGKVSEIGLVAADYPPPDPKNLNEKVYHQVVVQYRIDPRKLGRDADILEAIQHGLRVQVAPQGITGLAYLELSFVNPQNNPPQSVPWTPHHLVIPSVPSTLTEVQDAVQGFLNNMRHVKLGRTIDTLTSMIDTVNRELTTGSAHEALANVNGLLVELKHQVRQADLPATTRSMRTLADGTQTREILQQLETTSAALAKASAAMPALIAQSEATIRHANEATAMVERQMLPILQSLKQASANLEDLSDTLKRNPAAALRGREPPRETP
ncbi:MlaD family protein [Acidiphilium sp. JA12-A1]|uniref:MlaD family protein n=1 Tax=Acidiphilium sp. JA12-A1 TaxID=1464546 RepID=UPI00046132C1|nr:MlaD family protein [Acidiphilium sp. JA12-A1]KDM68460.1 ABC-type transport system periplasmic component [Acidiphilium sp. JA12-A1]